jgi:putative tryptophan/tyrosine transport system substrate-binding protein
MPSAYGTRLEVIRGEFKRRGQVEGRDITIEVRWGEERADKIASLAAELVALKPDVIITSASTATLALKKQTATIPIVFATISLPVERGIVASLSRPGGNVTGIMVHLLDGKLVELAREAFPRARRIAMLINEPDPAAGPALDLFLNAARRLKFYAKIVRVQRSEELGVALIEVVKAKPDALYIPNTSFMISNFAYIAERARDARIPVLAGRIEATEGGALLSYGFDRLESFRKAAALADRILRGANPAEIPIELPERLQLTVNMRAAKAMGVSIPQSIVMRANTVIE